MPQYLTPGVYIEEIPGQKPIAGVGTATGAFVGVAEKGQGEPKLITNLTQFRDNFGDPVDGWYLADAVTQFFIEGGTRCYVKCLKDATATTTLEKDEILDGLKAFDPIDDINILAIPDSVKLSDADLKATIIGAYGYCQNRKDCFFVADPPKSKNVQEISAFQTDTPALNSSYAALYYPWLKPLIGKKDYVPPSGAIAGIYAATDTRRGVHKAPAGVIDGNLKSAVGLECLVTNGEQAGLNENGINVIRSFPGAGLTVWGARTLCAKTDAEWKYVNVRRLFLFIEESIEEATQWVLFEPNTRSLWQTVKRDVTAFLTIVWRSGALFGSTAEEAFFVKVDDENNPPEIRDLGRLVIDIGVAPVKPAEFVIFRISQKTLGA